VIPFLPLFRASTPPSTPSGPGLRAVYFTDLGNDDPENLDGTIFAQRTEGPINWLYLGSAEQGGVAAYNTYPDSLPGTTNWAARFTGRIYAPETGLYTFKLYHDDGACLKIDGEVITSDWNDVGRPEGIVELTVGFHEIYLAYKQERLASAYLQLGWKKPSDSGFSVIPVASLFTT
jgi:hypothetical protein